MTAELELTTTRRTPHAASEATKVEQQRAIAEVQAAVLVAQQIPRDLSRCLAELKQSCDQLSLAERAFYRYSRGGQQVTGASVHLAREIARCFGNMDYGIRELSRDPQAGEHGQSEMMAYAWDQQTNVRQSNTFIVPWERHSRQGVSGLTDPRDLYETNANMGARRMREAIFAVVPTWIVEQAQTWCHETIQRGTGDKPFPQVVADMVTWYTSRRVTKPMLEAKLGRPSDQWTPPDVATLRVIATSLTRGEATIEDEFPDIIVTAEELIGTPTKTPRRKPEPAPEPPAGVDPETGEIDGPLIPAGVDS